MNNTGCVIGVDMGGTNVRCGAVSAQGEVIEVLSFKTRDFPSEEGFVERLADDIETLVRKHGFGNGSKANIGIGTPNGNYRRASVEFAPNLPFKGVFEIGKMLRQSLSCRMITADIALTNDANAAATGEKIYGKAKELDDFIMITLGTGVGSGIFANGKLLYGSSGFAGEIGHTIIVPQGRLCLCGRRGCLETYCSARGIVRTAEELLESEHAPSLLDALKGKTFEATEIDKAAEKGDALATECFKLTARHLALGLANAAAITSPKKIFITGGLSRAGEKFFNPLRAYFNDFLYPVFRNGIGIEPSGLGDGHAAILGAASLTTLPNR